MFGATVNGRCCVVIALALCVAGQPDSNSEYTLSTRKPRGDRLYRSVGTSDRVRDAGAEERRVCRPEGVRHAARVAGKPEAHRVRAGPATEVPVRLRGHVAAGVLSGERDGAHHGRTVAELQRAADRQRHGTPSVRVPVEEHVRHGPRQPRSHLRGSAVRAG